MNNREHYTVENWLAMVNQHDGTSYNLDQFIGQMKDGTRMSSLGKVTETVLYKNLVHYG